ncbi:MAG: ParA family protein, partial [Planctomycetota bacterium]
MRTLAIINQKGGCGKTTTAINLASVFAARGYKTLLLDLDPQSHCASGLAVPEKKIDRDIGDAISTIHDRPIDPGRLIWRVGRRFDLVPSRTKLAALEAPNGVLSQAEEPHRRLVSVIEHLNAARPGGYDVAIIDCSPSIGLLTYNALTAAREVIVPVETSFFSLQGAAKQLSTVRSVGRKIGMRHRARLLPTIHDTESPLARDLLSELKTKFADQLIPRVIRRDETVKLAASYGVPVIEHAPDSQAA